MNDAEIFVFTIILVDAILAIVGTQHTTTKQNLVNSYMWKLTADHVDDNR